MSAESTGFELVHQYTFEVVDFSSQYGSESGTSHTAGNLVGPCQVYPNYYDSNATCSFRTYGRWWSECPSALEPIRHSVEDYTTSDYVDLYFDIPVVPQRLQIFETYNPGAIVRVLGCYRRQPADSPVNARQLHWVTLWKAPRSNHSQIHPPCRLFRQLQLSSIRPASVADTLGSLNVDNSLALALTDSSVQRPGSSHDNPDLYEFTENEHPANDPFDRAHVFQPPLSNVPPYPVDLIRLEFDHSHCGYFTQIDAVRLSGWAEVSQRSKGCTQPCLVGSPSPVDDLPDQFSSPMTASSSTMSIFSNLLRPRTPQLCFRNPHESTIDAMELSVSTDSLTVTSPSGSPMLNTMTTRTTALSVSPVNKRLTAAPLTSLCRLPPVGLDVLLPVLAARMRLSVPPGAICPASLFGMMHVDETAVWRHGPLTRLPYEILLHIFSYLDLQSLCRATQVSRLFRCLSDDTLARLMSLNIQSFAPWITDADLSALGKRLGRVNLADRATAAAIASVSIKDPEVAPFHWLHRFVRESVAGETGPTQMGRRHRYLAARVRSWSSSAALVGIAAETPDEADALTHCASLSDCRPVEPDTARQLPDDSEAYKRDWSTRFVEAYKAVFPPCRLERLNMSWCGNYSQISPTVFGNFLGDACSRLHTLRLSSCKFLNDDCLLHIVNTCRQLRELDLSSCTGITPHGFYGLGRLIHLQWISLYRTQVTDDGLVSLAQLCQHLKHVDFGSCQLVIDMDNVLDHLTSNNPDLVSISLWRCVSVSALGIGHITRSCRQLEELDLGWCRSVAVTQEANSCIVQLVQQCQQMHKLYLTGTSLLNSDDLIRIGRLLRHRLQLLDIHGSASITPTAIAILLSQCSRLRQLDISYCPRLHWIDIIHLRRLFPFCTIIASRWMAPVHMDGGPVPPGDADRREHEMQLLRRRFEEQRLVDPWFHLFQRGIVHALAPSLSLALPAPGPRLLALPAPNPIPAIAGPVSE